MPLFWGRILKLFSIPTSVIIAYTLAAVLVVVVLAIVFGFVATRWKQKDYDLFAATGPIGTLKLAEPIPYNFVF